METNKIAHKHVRQIVTNELGITARSVREDVEKFVLRIVKQEVAEYLSRFQESGQLERLISEQVRTSFDPLYGKGLGHKDPLKMVVIEAARSYVREYMENNTEIIINLKMSAKEGQT